MGIQMNRRIMKKICMLGDGAVGKTSLIRRYVFDTFDDDYTPTIGTKIVKKEVSLPDRGVDVTFMLWDIMGHKSHMEVPQQYYLGAEGVLVVADLTRKETLDSLDYWYKTLCFETGPLPTILVINKVDLVEYAAFGSDDVEEMAGKMDAPYYFTSAKTGEHVEDVFVRLAYIMLQ